MDERGQGYVAGLVERVRGGGPWLIAAALAVTTVLWVGSGVVGGDGAQEPVAANSETATRSVPTVRVRHQQAEMVQRTIEVYGRTAPSRSITIKAETNGRVAAVVADRGGRTASGEPLIELDVRDREVRLSTAQALVRQRQLEYEAQLRLNQDNYISESNLAQAAANLESARAELHRAQLDLDHMIVRAPFAGSLQDRMVEVGDYVKSGDPVAEYVDDRTIIVTGSVSEQEIEAIRLGATGTVELATGQIAEGHIRYIAPVAETSTRTFTVELEIPNEDGALRGGMTAQLRIDAGTIAAQLISPRLAHPGRFGRARREDRGGRRHGRVPAGERRALGRAWRLDRWPAVRDCGHHRRSGLGAPGRSGHSGVRGDGRIGGRSRRGLTCASSMQH